MTTPDSAQKPQPRASVLVYTYENSIGIGELQDILTDPDKLTSAGLLGARIIQLSTANQQLRIELG